MKVTTRGQVTIPLAIRRHTGLVPHSEVDFKIVRGVVQLLVERLRKQGDVPLTTDEILALTRR
jgi:bifunctional DNA-binding transcriptional regulator/antitoxin component of YhaV-PrlF toxin-antitoxin module